VFTERDGKTTLTSTGLYPSREVPDAVLKAGLESSTRETFGRLADVQKSLQQSQGAA
jgi:hypothetical protein